METPVRCSLCGKHGQLDFCTFTIPFEYALKIREDSASAPAPPANNIIAETPPPPLTLETAECFLLCNDCKIKVQTDRCL